MILSASTFRSLAFVRTTRLHTFQPISRSMSLVAPLLVTPKALQDLRSAVNVNILDASWFMPNSTLNASNEFTKRHIPGAHYLDLDEVAASNELGLKHMMPSAQTFSDALEKFGITPTSHVVLYDSQGIFSAPRALFMFRSFGHGKSSVLDGGLPRWEVEGFPTETGTAAEISRSKYPVPSLASENIKSYKQVVSNADKELSDPLAEIVLDARPHGRYAGTDPEPRPGLSSGHIPHSFSLPFNALLQTNAVPNSDRTFTTFLPPSELRRKLTNAVGNEYAQLILEGKRSVTTTCGSGMTAGSTLVSLYDESWTGYASRPESTINKNVP
ncbi:thiosulfate sulfurtransferase [Multifurca ochricompacta]|uniref:Thiosulfate sulfurtransferase n=1 Tax=Multifurca ochricompacta TaxID=376703 RepID=A0AAD4MCX2_9AGAM|nr:thiosulfate sulfurtransferase [Multifurca ochricompacta]